MLVQFQQELRLAGCQGWILTCQDGILGCQDWILGCQDRIPELPGPDSELPGQARTGHVPEISEMPEMPEASCRFLYVDICIHTQTYMYM